MMYLKDGRECELVCEIPDGAGFVVSVYQHDSETGDAYLNGTHKIVKAVFEKPPIDRIAQEYSDLEKQLRTKRSELHEVNRELSKAENERKRLLDKLKQVPGLQRLEDWIDGKVTHFVTVDYGRVTVVPKAEMSCGEDSGRRSYIPKRIKLITLFGESDGTLVWNANQYRDGSGSHSTECYLCCSEEEAREVAGQIIEREWSSEKVHHLQYLINSADIIGHPVPEHLREKAKAYKAEDLLRQLESRRKELEKVEAELRLLNGPELQPVGAEQ